MGTRQEELDSIERTKKILEKLEDVNKLFGELNDIRRELKLTRKGNEAFVYGAGVEESDEVDLEDIENA